MEISVSVGMVSQDEARRKKIWRRYRVYFWKSTYKNMHLGLPQILPLVWDGLQLGRWKRKFDILGECICIYDISHAKVCVLMVSKGK